MVTIIVLMMPFTVVQSKTGQHFIMLNHQNHLVAFLRYLKSVNAVFYDFIFTKGLLQSSHELILAKKDNTFDISHYYWHDSSSITIFQDFKVLSQTAES